MQMQPRLVLLIPVKTAMMVHVSLEIQTRAEPKRCDNVVWHYMDIYKGQRCIDSKHAMKALINIVSMRRFVKYFA